MSLVVLTLVESKVYGKPAVFSNQNQNQESKKNTSVRVRIKKQQKNIFISALKLQIINQFGTPSSQNDFADFKRIEIKTNENGFVVISDEKQSRFDSRFLLIRGRKMTVNGEPQPEHLLLMMDPKSPVKSPGKSFDVIALLPLDSYVVGVLSGEMPLNWPMETLKAQAVLARNYVLKMILQKNNEPFHVENSVIDQVFEFGKKSQKMLERAHEAVTATEDLVLVNKQGEPESVYYHSHCGGMTTLAERVWVDQKNKGAQGLAPATKFNSSNFKRADGIGVKDSFCELSQSYNWQYQISADLLEKKLGIDSFDKIQLEYSLDDARVEKVVLIKKNSLREKAISIQGNRFRELVGFSLIKSTRFKIAQQNGIYKFEGSGNGHGVGMCQAGAKFLGLQGRTYSEILRHYYPQSDLKREDSLVIPGHRLQASNERMPKNVQ